MIIFVYMFGIVFFFVLLCYYIGKGIKSLYNSIDFDKNKNFYIEHHKSKVKNDKQYQEYLKYLQKNEPDTIPRDKNKSISEVWYDAKIDEMLN